MLKTFSYFIFSVFFGLGRIRGVRKNRVSMLSPHHENFNDSLGCVSQELEKRGGFEIGYITTADLNFDRKNIFGSLKNIVKFFVSDAVFLASSEYVFLNDNFMPMSQLNFNKKTVVTQLWHAEGAFKKFGLHLNLDEEVRSRTIEGNKRLTWLVCTSEKIRKIYAEAFGVPENKVVALGSARSDRCFEEQDLDSLKKAVFKDCPECEGKKLILYAPTFRDDTEDNRRLLESIDINKFESVLGKEYALLIRLHPQIHDGVKMPEGAFDFTAYPDFNELVKVCDMLITDYSSVCMDFVLVNKPCIFYAFDLDSFNMGRSFYFDYSDVPGPVVKTFDELMEAIKNATADNRKAEAFKALHMSAVDGKSTERIVDFVLNKGTGKK